MPKKREASDVLHFLLPQLESVDIPIINIRIDTSTAKTGRYRGDVWISREPTSSPYFESEIIALIEAKPPCEIPGSVEWDDAVMQGKNKATRQKLPYFAVTNTASHWKYYRTDDLIEITFDGEEIKTSLGINDLEILVTQISPTCSNAIHTTGPPPRSYSQKEFQQALWQIKNIYRNCALDDPDKKIHTTITFIVLKYITEQERIKRTLPKRVMLWGDWRPSNMERDIKSTIEDIKTSRIHSDVAKELLLAKELKATHCKDIHSVLSSFQFSGSNFDLYGAVYESFADKHMKKEFGQFYTSRHIAKVLSEIILSNEIRPRPLKICDPACGTGGFLTESYRILLRNYTASGTLEERILRRLKEETFYGYDIKNTNVSLAKINMCLAGDGHTNINYTDDSLLTLPENTYDYVLTNVPMGVYKGEATEGFYYSNVKRYELKFLEKIVKSLAPQGRAVVIVPDGVLESPSLENYRINFLNDVDLESVISLHQYVFRPYSTEKTYAIIFRKITPKERSKTVINKIFMYILENDGFQKGDKRYVIRENDIPDLKVNYLSSTAKAPHIFVDRASINNSNFHNLLPEFYLNYYEHDYSDVSKEEYLRLITKVNDLIISIKGISA